MTILTFNFSSFFLHTLSSSKSVNFLPNHTDSSSFQSFYSICYIRRGFRSKSFIKICHPVKFPLLLSLKDDIVSCTASNQELELETFPTIPIITEHSLSQSLDDVIKELKRNTDSYLSKLSKTDDETKSNSSSKKRSMDESNKENEHEYVNNNKELLNENTFIQEQSSPKKSKGNYHEDCQISLTQGNISNDNQESNVTMIDTNQPINKNEKINIDQHQCTSSGCVTTSSPPYAVSNAEAMQTVDPVELQYQLSAVVRHIGVTAFAGHYICDTLAPPSSSFPSSSSFSSSNPIANSPSIPTSTSTSTTTLAQNMVSSFLSGHEENSNSDSNNAESAIWNRTNDSLVHRIPESTVLADMESPYIFFYTRI